MRILIVEDDIPSRELLESFLAEFGTCETAANGHEALEAVIEAINHDEPYDLVCMDIMMPLMDGMEALRRIRRLEIQNFKPGSQSTKIILITAKGQARDVIDATDSGCDGYLIKPISKDQLYAQLAELNINKSTEHNR